MPDTTRFSLLTLIEAANLLTYKTQAEFNNFILRLCAEQYVLMRLDLSKENKANQLIQFAKKNPDHETVSGSNVMDEIVEEAAEIVKELRNRGANSLQYEAFIHALARDGFTLTDEEILQKTLPPIADLPEADDELHELLDKLGMAQAKGHLDQAIDNHSRGQWAAANGQLRTFIEDLFNEIFRRLEPTRANDQLTSENRRELLASRKSPFLQESLGEWGQQGKNFINGVFKRLHNEGSHPGLSDEEDCTFRLHLVLMVARYYLRRTQSYINTSS